MITIKTQKEIEILRQGGKILAKILDQVVREAKAGVSTGYLNKVARDLILSFDAKPAFEGYRPTGAAQPYPCALCTSLNQIVVHGVPNDKVVLKDGDVLKLDLGIQYKNLFTDAAVTMIVGEGVSDKNKINLIGVTKKALGLGIAHVKPGNRIGDIGAAIDNYVKSHGLSVIQALVGHGVGYTVHEEPNIPNYGKAGSGPELKPGMVLAIEPMVTTGGSEVKESEDGFGYETTDGSLSAHFEHTVLVTENSYLILTE